VSLKEDDNMSRATTKLTLFQERSELEKADILPKLTTKQKSLIDTSLDLFTWFSLKLLKRFKNNAIFHNVIRNKGKISREDFTLTMLKLVANLYPKCCKKELIIIDNEIESTKAKLTIKQAQLENGMSSKVLAAEIENLEKCPDENPTKLTRLRLIQHSTKFLNYFRKSIGAADIDEQEEEIRDLEENIAEAENRREFLMLVLKELNNGEPLPPPQCRVSMCCCCCCSTTGLFTLALKKFSLSKVKFGLESSLSRLEILTSCSR